jgi:hypothetical protein
MARLGGCKANNGFATHYGGNHCTNAITARPKLGKNFLPTENE